MAVMKSPRVAAFWDAVWSLTRAGAPVHAGRRIEGAELSLIKVMPAGLHPAGSVFRGQLTRRPGV